MSTTSDTKTQLLDAAQELVTRRGFNAFSYKDLAEVVGIRTASIHYHFESKAKLGQALMQRYTSELEGALAGFDQRLRSEKARLEAFIGMYTDTEKRGAMCLCGSFASDLGTLPGEIADEVQAYLDRCEAWVKACLVAGIATGEFRATSKPADLAASLVAGLQGGLILARAQSGSPLLARVRRSFLQNLDA